MNLRKALDKAKQMREARSGRPLAAGKAVVVTRSPDREWKPPEYTQSCCMQVQPAELMKNRCVCIEPDAVELEAYKVLRTRIQLAVKMKGWNTLLITSANPGEGKTLTAVNLALTFAKAYNQTVMLIDCDLRRQYIHRVLGLESRTGIVDFLVDDKPLNEFIIWPGVEKLTLISGGRSIQNSAEVLGSERMRALMQELKTRYNDRFIILDAPPVLSAADTLALAPCVDCILMVVKEGETRLAAIKKSLEVIPRDKFLGYVVNHQRRAEKAYYY
jgi:non-specific protein-tyrosine kinase